MIASRLALITAVAAVTGLCSFASAVAPVTPSIDAVQIYPMYGTGYGTWNGSTLFLARGALAQIDLTLPSEGVQHLSYDMNVATSIDMFTHLSDWLGLYPGSTHVWTTRNNYDDAHMATGFNAFAANTAPSWVTTPSDLVATGFHNWYSPGMNYAIPWSLGTTYGFEYTFDFEVGTTRLVIGASGLPVFDRTWPAVRAPSALDFGSQGFRPWDPSGSLVTVTNLSVTGIPEPAALPLAAAGGLFVIRRRRS